MNSFVTFMSNTGRVTRAVAGIALIVIGALIGSTGWILAVVGLGPLLAGVFEFCLFAPLFRAPSRARRSAPDKALNQRQGAADQTGRH